MQPSRRDSVAVLVMFAPKRSSSKDHRQGRYCNGADFTRDELVQSAIAALMDLRSIAAPAAD
jgi:hypothetical protein